MNLSSLLTSAANAPACRASSTSRQRSGAKCLASATLALAATAPLVSAHATVIYTSLNDGVTSEDVRGGVVGTSVNVVLATESFDFSSYSGKDSGIRLSNLAADFGVVNFTDYGGYGIANTTAAGRTVGDRGHYSTYSTVEVYYQGSIPGDGYFGFSFDPTGAAVNYGWGSFSFDANGDVTLTGLAYDDSGVEIVVGDTGPAAAVPEPALPLLMTAGVIGLATRRRRPAKA